MVEDSRTKVRLNPNKFRKIEQLCWAKGLIFQAAAATVIKVKPALIINREEVDTALGIFEEVFCEALRT